MSQPPSVTLIAGPTASGKSALALKMARETGAVIINADSQQLYADLRILTARPSEEDEALAEHRLYGFADAADAWSVGRWSRAVQEVLKQEADRPAILVGGTGLYFEALTRGLADIPDVPLDVRNETAAMYDEMGEIAFRTALRGLDPQAEARIEGGDRQRLVRAMSVWRASGRSLSEWQADTRPMLAPCTWKGLLLRPDRAALYVRCDARTEWMMDAGAAAEVEILLSRKLSSDLPLMKAVGVRELGRYIDGLLGREEAAASVKQATRNYAKRQMTWMRGRMADWSAPLLD